MKGARRRLPNRYIADGAKKRARIWEICSREKRPFLSWTLKSHTEARWHREGAGRARTAAKWAGDGRGSCGLCRLGRLRGVGRKKRQAECGQISLRGRCFWRI